MTAPRDLRERLRLLGLSQRQWELGIDGGLDEDERVAVARGFAVAHASNHADYAGEIVAGLLAAYDEMLASQEASP